MRGNRAEWVLGGWRAEAAGAEEHAVDAPLSGTGRLPYRMGAGVPGLGIGLRRLSGHSRQAQDPRNRAGRVSLRMMAGIWGSGGDAEGTGEDVVEFVVADEGGDGFGTGAVGGEFNVVAGVAV